MKINRNNYEQYFLDFVEGKLNPVLQEELEQFLEANQDLKNELEEFENISVPDNQEIKFNRKSSLKKNFVSAGKINENNYENFLIGEIENDLNEIEAENLKTFISKNPFIEKEQKLFRNTILFPDKKIHFPNKTELKKTAIIRIGWKQAATAVGIAASILLLLYFNFNEPDKNELAEKHESENLIRENANYKQKYKPVKEQENIFGVEKPAKEKIIIKQKSVAVPEMTVDNSKAVVDSLPFVDDNPIAENNSEENIEKEKMENIPEIISEESFAELNSENINSSGYPELTETDDSFTLKEYLALSFKKNVLKENISKKKKEAKITPVDLASAAVKGFSKIFGSDIKMKKSYNDNGELDAVAISSPRFEISQTLHKK